MGELAKKHDIHYLYNLSTDEYIKFGDMLTIGQEGCHINLEDPKVNKKHCKLVKKEHGVFIADLGSKYRTKLNDGTLDPLRLHIIEQGDVFYVGDTMFVYTEHNELTDEFIKGLSVDELDALEEENFNFNPLKPETWDVTLKKAVGACLLGSIAAVGLYYSDFSTWPTAGKSAESLDLRNMWIMAGLFSGVVSAILFVKIYTNLKKSKKEISDIAVLIGALILGYGAASTIPDIIYGDHKYIKWKNNRTKLINLYKTKKYKKTQEFSAKLIKYVDDKGYSEAIVENTKNLTEKLDKKIKDKSKDKSAKKEEKGEKDEKTEKK